jgi:elongation factor Ts
MATITAAMVSELRSRTGAGMMECKKALTECDGDMEKAVLALQKMGLAATAKRAARVASEGAIGAYVHMGRIGVLVEVNSETDFSARSELFQQLVKDVAMHVAASNPAYLDESQIPQAKIDEQKSIFLSQSENSGKPAHIVEKMIEGKLSKWKKEICLVDQPFVKDPDKSVGQYVTEVAAQIKENIKVRRFTRFELGEGIEKAEKGDFAAEVAAAAKG